jgi:hypothetical protein
VRRRFAFLLAGVVFIAACGSGGSSGRPSVSRPNVTSGITSPPEATSQPPVNPTAPPRPTTPPRTSPPTNPPRTSPPQTSPPQTSPPPTSPPTTKVVAIVPTPTTGAAPASPTTVAPSGATAAPASSSDSSSDAWIWVVVAIVVLALALGGYFWWRRRQQQARAAEAWRAELATTTADVTAARDLLHDAAGESIEPTRLESLRHQADAAAAGLGRLAANAPDDEARSATSAAEQALRNYVVAVDAEQLLRTRTPPASADALADANVTRRARGDALEEALTGLQTLQAGTRAEPVT